MKLETKHLTAYLPYKLKVRVEDYKCDYVNREFDEVIGLHQWDKSGLLWSALTDGGAKPSLDRIKPVLRTLSDLTKEIEVNGNKFVPCEELLKTKFKQHYNSETISRYKEICYNSRVVWFQNIANYNMDIPNKINVLEQPYWVFQYLLELHFDIFGLIENNLAIDINTLNK